jgi:hypothetical protein
VQKPDRSGPSRPEPARAKHYLTLSVLPDTLAVARLGARDPLPDWLDWADPFVAVARTADELSIVCRGERVPAAVRAERDWAALRVEGPLDFALTGVLASLAVPLAEASVTIFALSTFDTDYVLVRRRDLARAVQALSATCRVAGA